MAQRVNKPKNENEPDLSIFTGKTPTQIKEMYLKLQADYNLEKEKLYCHSCGRHLVKSNFYLSTKWKSGVVPTCKKCLYIIGTGYNESTKRTNETIDTVKTALKLMDLPFIKDLYEASATSISADATSTKHQTVFQQMVTMLQSLPQYKGKSWLDSDFDVLEADRKGFDSSAKAKQKSIKFFGAGMSDEDYVFLQDQYDDWKVRYSIEDKAMEELVKRICFKQLDLWKAQRSGKETKELDKTFQELLASANLKPAQTKNSLISDALTFGQLIQKWEEEKPIPEPEEEFKDVDKIGLYIDVFFKGHLAKMLDLKNPLSHIYTKFMDKYTVKKPEYDAEEHSEQLFESIFGRKENDDVI